MKLTTKVVILSLLLAITLSGCGINIELPFKTESKTGETVIESIQVPVPNLNPPLDVNLSFGAGKMTLLPNPGPDLLSGTVTYNVADFKPEIIVDDNGVTLKQGNLKINAVPTINGSIKNEWNVSITNHPIELSIMAGAYSGDFEFGGLALTDLHVTDGASNVNLKFSTPNTSLMNAFRYETGASNITMEKLGNASTFINVLSASYNFTKDLWIQIFVQNNTAYSRIYLYGKFGWRFKPPFTGLLFCNLRHR